MQTNNIGQYIKSCREARSLTQAELAKAIAVSDVFVSRVESGQKKPGLGLLSAIGVALDCDVGYLRYLLWDAPSEVAGLSEKEWQKTVEFVLEIKNAISSHLEAHQYPSEIEQT